MKLFRISAMAIAALSFAACSSNDEVADVPGGISENGGSVTLRIAMPTTNGTRALGGDPTDETGKSYNDGDADEYAVQNAVVALFNDDTDPVCLAVQTYTAADLGFNTVGTPTDRVTSESVTLVYGKGATPSYALAILNSAGDVATPVIGSTYSAYLDSRTDDTNKRDAKNADGYFMMTNAVHTADGTATGHEDNIFDGKTGLQKINPNSITKERVVASEFTLISVERVNAKVTITTKLDGQSTKYPTSSVSGKTISFTNGAKTDKLTLLGWCLTAKNKTYWPVKHISEAEKSATAPGWANDMYQMYNRWDVPSFFRTHWGHDTNYDNAYWSTASGISLNASGAPKGDLQSEFIYSTFADAKGNTDFDKALYCLENTFDVTNQQQNQTTSILLAAQYVMEDLSSASDKSFYSIARKAYTPTDAPAAIAAALTAGNFYTDAAHTVTVAASNIVFGADHKPALATGVSLYKSTETTPSTLADALSAVYGTDSPTTYYEGGYCYYTVRIKHFGDAECKLYDTDDSYYVHNGTSGINSADKLGRYGVLRNTWYSIDINSISGFGRPVVDPEDPSTPPINPDPDPDGPTPDDEEEYFISAKIQILPWALRNQSADL